MGSLLYENCIPVNENNDSIKIYIPTVGEIIDNEEEYYGLVNLITAMPIDMMVQLDDVGIDFTEITEYELFLIMFRALQAQDTSLVFGDLDLTKFEYATEEHNKYPVLVDRENDIVIDIVIHDQMATILRNIHHLEKNLKKPGNIEAKKYLLERARRQLKRKKREKRSSQMEQLVVAMVNTEQFKYNFAETRELSIYQFNESVRQIIKKVDYSNKMFGVYSGSINPKDLHQDDLNWLVHK